MLGAVLGLAILVATAACSGAAEPTPGAPQATATAPPGAAQPSTAMPAPSAEATPAPAASPVPAASPGQSAFPLGEPGPYHVSRRTFTTEDPSRGDRFVAITVWYPAVRPPDWKDARPSIGAIPDRSGAPYPLILSSTTVAMELAPDLVSHGFAWASVNNINTYPTVDDQAIDQPLDILFALDQVAAHPPEGLEGVIDAERAGAVGYSFDGFNTLAMSGARVDPEYYLAQCPTPDATTAAVLSELSAFGCGPAENWAAFAAHAGTGLTASEDGLWRPMTDRRIRAVMPMAAEGWWLFGPRGLAAADRPTLMLAGTKDELYPENALIFERLGAPDKAMISFLGQDHFTMLLDQEMAARMAHFAVAFFGHHLQGREELAQYYSEAFVARHDDLAWGVHPDE
jgi:predicted dienelactone hydrolase